MVVVVVVVVVDSAVWVWLWPWIVGVMVADRCGLLVVTVDCCLLQ